MQRSRIHLTHIALRTLSLLAFGLLVSLSARVYGNDVLPGQTDQFADANVTLRLRLPHEAAANAPAVAWHVSANYRTLTRGTTRLKLAKDVDAESDCEIQSESPESIWLLEILTPKVNHGVVVDSTLSFQLPGADSFTTTPIRLHHRDPLESIRQTLTAKGVAIVDAIGSTRAAFDSISWQPRRAASLDQVKSASIVILGEAMHWDAALIAEAELMATRGTKFIVLRPDAKSYWPMTLDPLKTKRLELLQSLPTGPGACRLDDRFWQQPPKPSLGWKLTGSDESIRIEPSPRRTTDGEASWQLIHVHVGEHGGGFLFVGFNLIERFDQSPVPRETFKSLLIGCMNDSEQNFRSEISSQAR